MSDLTDSIALAHRTATMRQSLGHVQCLCGEWTIARGSEGMLDVQGRHVAEVTEAAVRTQVAAEIEAAMVNFPSSAMTLAAHVARTGATPTPAARWRP